MKIGRARKRGINPMEMSILHMLQSLHNPVLDQIMVTIFNTLIGSIGQIWIVVGIVLLIIPKTRKCGVAVLLSYAASLLIGNECLKDLIARPRPCAVDDTVQLIVKKPGSFLARLFTHTWLFQVQWRFITISRSRELEFLYLRPWWDLAECISLFTIHRTCYLEQFWVS